MIRRLRLPRIPPLGIRTQLTCWYTLVSAVLLLLIGIAFYTAFQQSLAASFDMALQQRAQQVAEGITNREGKLVVDDVVDELPELDTTTAIIDSSSNDSRKINFEQGSHFIHDRADIFVRVLDIHGQTVYSTFNFYRLSVPSESVTQPLHNIPWRGTVSMTRGDEPVRLYSTMLVENGKLMGVIQIGQSLARLHMSLESITYTLFVVIAFILTISAFVSYWLAGRAFRPIHHLAYTAREIGAKDLHQRVPVPPADDEVRALSLIFNQMIGRLERAFNQQRRFVADASHELRTPVAVIRSMTEVALSQPTSPEGYETVLREVNAEAERLGRLINDLLALARADEGKAQLDSELVRVDLLAADAVESLEPLAQERNIELRTRILQPATIMGDAARLIQVIMSLVDNALIYTNAGGTVTVSVETCASHVHLSVSDTGIGIAHKDIEHIFERFYRADPARSKASGGSGLGLAIVDWVVRAHQGIVSVESQPGRGSTFTVTLPRSLEE
ncbi:MAG TPA: ATP-binding protein [Ktedonobacteraceae bacterium]|nr:ATP-binding protein [Ktedonobacteraceae bacterium]